MLIKAIAATTKLDNNGNKLSEAQLGDLARTAVGKNVGIEFNPFIPPVGKITKAYVENGSLVVEALIEDIDTLGYYIAPSYSIDKNTRICESLDYALTTKHSDNGASTIKK